MVLTYLFHDSTLISWGLFRNFLPSPPPILQQTIEMWKSRVLLTLAQLATLTVSAPSGFPTSGNGLWYTTTGNVWSREWLPVGNGYLGAMVPGGTSNEVTQLNIESLWSGGPFADKSYNGGNKQSGEREATAQAMQKIRQTIFDSPTGDIEDIKILATDSGAYGSYAGAGYLVSGINTTGTISNYARWLDLDQGLARTSWTQSGANYLRSTFCSHPTQACVQHITSTISSSASGGLPALTYAFSSALESGLPTPNITCQDPSTLRIRGFVDTPGMLYEIIARVRVTTTAASPPNAVKCIQFPVPFGAPPNATIEIAGGVAREAWVSWVGGTEYSMDAGDAVHDFSFRGPDPHDALLRLINPPSTGIIDYSRILAQHVADYKAALTDKFSLSLGQTPRLDVPTDVVKAEYKTDVGDPYLEWLLFNYGRYLLVSSGRGVLPANLQGKWANGHGNAWSSDYHANINIQMNYWSAEMTNLNVHRPLFDYFQKTWAPRGEFTAQVLYNITRGWVVHNEVNVFGHSGMKAWENSALWANYPEANVWMMMHVWDHFDYNNDIAWWKAQGWPLIKAVASFHLDKLIPDLYFKDSSLVVSPCNSPEQEPITFGCAHAQQMIWELFNAVEKGFAASGDTDKAFLAEVKRKRAQMDKGLRIGSWGQLQEWKIDRDSPADTHRHLSHLIGLYPGYSITGYDTAINGGLLINGTRATYTRAQVIDAATVSLAHRGDGTGPDADSGWEKAWRAAAWAQLGNAEKFYHILTYGIAINFGANLFSLYNPYNPDPIFQIDANLAYPSALLNALIQAPDVASISTPLTITILPALPKQWPTGAIRGARVRGGMTVDLKWSSGRPNAVSIKVDAKVVQRPVRIVYGGKTIGSFVTSSGSSRSFTRF
ncbi:glycoside hydrolase family 95 protein [Collybia nuda]|uniref:Glycoside hydrolase family 95 protein n=1 Tax=Collybia nuda TaxID=64659 RepID=A0A9P6CME5_9AGAR|nr:glycoside hydrolase family 95 protein [Collybia nuda]